MNNCTMESDDKSDYSSGSGEDESDYDSSSRHNSSTGSLELEDDDSQVLPRDDDLSSGDDEDDRSDEEEATHAESRRKTANQDASSSSESLEWDEEVRRCGLHLGIDIEQEPHFLWIAKVCPFFQMIRKVSP